METAQEREDKLVEGVHQEVRKIDPNTETVEPTTAKTPIKAPAILEAGGSIVEEMGKNILGGSNAGDADNEDFRTKLKRRLRLMAGNTHTVVEKKAA